MYLRKCTNSEIEYPFSMLKISTRLRVFFAVLLSHDINFISTDALYFQTVYILNELASYLL